VPFSFTLDERYARVTPESTAPARPTVITRAPIPARPTTVTSLYRPPPSGFTPSSQHWVTRPSTSTATNTPPAWVRSASSPTSSTRWVQRAYPGAGNSSTSSTWLNRLFPGHLPSLVPGSIPVQPRWQGQLPYVNGVRFGADPYNGVPITRANASRMFAHYNELSRRLFVANYFGALYHHYQARRAEAQRLMVGRSGVDLRAAASQQRGLAQIARRGRNHRKAAQHDQQADLYDQKATNEQQQTISAGPQGENVEPWYSRYALPLAAAALGAGALVWSKRKHGRKHHDAPRGA
jgi:hypothetical protein